MKNRSIQAILLASCLLLLVHCGEAPPAPEQNDADIGLWTEDNFPSYIRRITHFGQRAEWSHDGSKILFLEKTYGDAYVMDLASGVIRAATHHYYHNGYTRALYLPNGDILLSGSRTFDPENHSDARRKTAELWVLSKDLDKPPVTLGEFCSEGPTVSRKNLKIAWAADHGNYPDTMPEGVSQMYVADIDYSSGEPKIANKKTVLDNRNTDFKANFETQNFIAPDETMLTFSAYGYQGSEVMGLNTETGEVTNFSSADVQYDEPEGIFPDGKHTLVECDKHTGPDFKGVKHIELWKLTLDGSGEYQRLTYFNEGGIFKASNPVVSDDGRYIAFQVPRSALIAGVGNGIYIMDLEAAGLR